MGEKPDDRIEADPLDHAQRCMAIALLAARSAAQAGDIPVGAVVSDAQGRVIAAAGNACRLHNDPSAHAEMRVIRTAAQLLRTWRLDGMVLYSTLEPCAMCAGAIAIARLAKVVFGAVDAKAGAVVSGVRFFDQPTCHHRPLVMHGVMHEESALLLRRFFVHRRKDARLRS